MKRCVTSTFTIAAFTAAEPIFFLLRFQRHTFYNLSEVQGSSRKLEKAQVTVHSWRL
jgi:hypothetical protein